MREGVGREVIGRDGRGRDGTGSEMIVPVTPSTHFAPAVEADEAVPGDGPLALMQAMLRVIRRHQLALALWVLACLAASAIHAWSQPPSYEAAAQMLLEPRRAAIISPREVQAPPVLDLNRADSELQVLRSERLLSEVFASLGLADDPELQPAGPGLVRSAFTQALQWGRSVFPGGSLMGLPSPAPSPAAQAEAEAQRVQIAFEQFAQRLSARRVGQSFVIEIGYTASNPQQAARVANAAASAYLKQSVAFKAEAARSGAEFVQGRVDVLLAQVQAAENAMRAGALPQAPMPDADVRVIGAALPPLAASAPRKSLILAFGGMLGLLSALFVIAVAGALDRKVRSAQRLMRETGLNCLASVPDMREWGGLVRPSDPAMRRLVKKQPQGEFCDAMREVRMAIRLALPSARAKGHQIIAFTSPRRGAGCSTLCMNFAHIIKRTQGTPTLIDADIRGGRRAALAGAMRRRWRGGTRAGSLAGGFAYGHGALVDLLNGTARLDQLVVINVEGVALVPARSVDATANLSVDFSDPRLAQILEVARGRGDVLIDLPAVLDGAEARVLAQQADAVVLVVDAARSSLEDVAQAARLLRSAGAKLAGVVINRAEP